MITNAATKFRSFIAEVRLGWQLLKTLVYLLTASVDKGARYIAESFVYWSFNVEKELQEEKAMYQPPNGGPPVRKSYLTPILRGVSFWMIFWISKWALSIPLNMVYNYGINKITGKTAEVLSLGDGIMKLFTDPETDAAERSKYVDKLNAANMFFYQDITAKWTNELEKFNSETAQWKTYDFLQPNTTALDVKELIKTKFPAAFDGLSPAIQQKYLELADVVEKETGLVIYGHN